MVALSSCALLAFGLVVMVEALPKKGAGESVMISPSGTMRRESVTGNMSHITGNVAGVSAIALRRAEPLTSNVYPVVTFEQAEVARFRCSGHNRAPCTKSPEGRETDCNRAQPRCDWELWWDKVEGPWMPCCEKRNLFELMAFFHNTVYKHIDVHGKGFWYSLALGTAIASLRNADIVDWDTDIDVVVPEKHFAWLTELLKDASQKMTPPYLVKHSDDDNGVLRLFLSLENDAHIDIWPGKNFDPEHPQACVGIGQRSYPAAASFPLQKCNLQGSMFPCFAEGSKYLEYQYGKDWKTPSTNKGGIHTCDPSSFTVPPKLPLLDKIEKIFR